MGFPKGASIPFGQGRGQYLAREVPSFIDSDDTTIDTELSNQPRRPVDGVIQNAGHAVVIFRRDDRHRVGAADNFLLIR
jgi:hypothetical protein